MITKFERIPDIFVELYDYQFRVWAEEYRKRGPRQAINFRRPPGAPLLYDGEGRVIQFGAWLVAEPEDNGVMRIRPASDQDEEVIVRHCREMRGSVVQ